MSPNIFIITIHPVTLISIDDPILLLDWISVFRSHQEVLDGGASLAIHLYHKLSANVLNALTESTIVWYHYIRLLLGVVIGSVYWSLKEALYIRVNDPSLKRNVGKYHLPHLWDEVLVNTSN